MQFSVPPTYGSVICFLVSGSASDKDGIESANGAATLPSSNAKPDETGQKFFSFTNACYFNSCSFVWFICKILHLSVYQKV